MAMMMMDLRETSNFMKLLTQIADDARAQGNSRLDVIAELDTDIPATCAHFGITADEWKEAKEYFSYGIGFDQARQLLAGPVKHDEVSRFWGAECWEFVLYRNNTPGTDNWAWFILKEHDGMGPQPKCVWQGSTDEPWQALEELTDIVKTDFKQWELNEESAF